MKVSTEIDNNFGYDKITQLVDNIPLSNNTPFKETFAQSLSSNILVEINSIILKLYVTWPTSPKCHIPQKFEFSKNIIFNQTDSFVGRNTCEYACQIFCSKSNCETMYHRFFLLEITVVKIMNNLNVCSAHSYLFPRYQFNETLLYQLVRFTLLEMAWLSYYRGLLK